MPMCVCMCPDAHRGQQKALDPRVGVTDSCEHPNESEANPTQEEQHKLLTTEPSFQPRESGRSVAERKTEMGEG